MLPQAEPFHLGPKERRKIEQQRRREKDARLHNRLAALLWLDEGRSPDEVAALLGLHLRTIANWVKLYQKKGWRVLPP